MLDENSSIKLISLTWFWWNYNFSPVKKHGKYFLEESIESKRSLLDYNIHFRLNRIPGLKAVEVCRSVPMFYHYSFRFAGGAGSVEDVG